MSPEVWLTCMNFVVPSRLMGVLDTLTYQLILKSFLMDVLNHVMWTSQQRFYLLSDFGLWDSVAMMCSFVILRASKFLPTRASLYIKAFTNMMVWMKSCLSKDFLMTSETFCAGRYAPAFFGFVCQDSEMLCFKKMHKSSWLGIVSNKMENFISTFGVDVFRVRIFDMSTGTNSHHLDFFRKNFYNL